MTTELDFDEAYRQAAKANGKRGGFDEAALGANQANVSYNLNPAAEMSGNSHLIDQGFRIQNTSINLSQQDVVATSNMLEKDATINLVKTYTGVDGATYAPKGKVGILLEEGEKASWGKPNSDGVITVTITDAANNKKEVNFTGGTLEDITIDRRTGNTHEGAITLAEADRQAALIAEARLAAAQAAPPVVPVPVTSPNARTEEQPMAPKDPIADASSPDELERIAKRATAKLNEMKAAGEKEQADTAKDAEVKTATAQFKSAVQDYAKFSGMSQAQVDKTVKEFVDGELGKKKEDRDTNIETLKAGTDDWKAKAEKLQAVFTDLHESVTGVETAAMWNKKKEEEQAKAAEIKAGAQPRIDQLEAKGDGRAAGLKKALEEKLAQETPLAQMADGKLSAEEITAEGEKLKKRFEKTKELYDAEYNAATGTHPAGQQYVEQVKKAQSTAETKVQTTDKATGATADATMMTLPGGTTEASTTGKKAEDLPPSVIVQADKAAKAAQAEKTAEADAKEKEDAKTALRDEAAALQKQAKDLLAKADGAPDPASTPPGGRTASTAPKPSAPTTAVDLDLTSAPPAPPVPRSADPATLPPAPTADPAVSRTPTTATGTAAAGAAVGMASTKDGDDLNLTRDGSKLKATDLDGNAVAAGTQVSVTRKIAGEDVTKSYVVSDDKGHLKPAELAAPSTPVVAPVSAPSGVAAGR